MTRHILETDAGMRHLCAAARSGVACLVALGIVLALGACARVLQTVDEHVNGIVGSGSSDATPVPAPAALRVGDTLTYDAGVARGPVYVTAVSGNRVSWADSAGDKWTGFADPTVPPIEQYDAKDATTTTRAYAPAAPTIFPLVPEKVVRYQATVTRSGEPGSAVEHSVCTVSRPRPLEVAVGKFDAWEIVCQRDDATDVYYYAPKIGAVVLRSHDSNGAFQRLALAGYQLGASSAGGANAGAPMPAVPRQPVTSESLAPPLPATPQAAPAAAPAAMPAPQPARKIAQAAEPTPTPAQTAAAPPPPPAEVSPQMVPAVQEPASKPAPASTPAPAPMPAPVAATPPPAPTPTPAAAPAPTPAPAPATQTASAPPGLVPAPALPSGVYMVQLGAMRSFDAAHQVWVNARNNAPQLLGTLTPRVDPIETPNGATLVRLSVGPFNTADAATQVCDALRAARLECFVRRIP